MPTALVGASLLVAFLAIPRPLTHAFSFGLVTHAMSGALRRITGLLVTSYTRSSFIALAYTEVARTLPTAVFVADTCGAIGAIVALRALALATEMIAVAMA